MRYFSHFNPMSYQPTPLHEGLQSLLFFVIRLYFGYEFLVAGLSKFSDIDKVASFFATLGIPFSLWSAYLIAGIETIGGLFLILGFCTRIAAAILFIVMIGAYLTAHFDAIRHLFDNPALFTQEPPFLFLIATLFIFAFGPGKFSLDYLLRKCCKY